MYNPNTRRKLLHDISMDELYRMREDGMTNGEIAEAIGVSRVTVYRYIGKQPEKKEQGIDSMKKTRQTQTEKFISRMERRTVNAAGAQQEARKAVPTQGNQDAETSSAHEATEANMQPWWIASGQEVKLPKPTRVIKQYSIGDGILITCDNGNITITGAENMGQDAIRRLCRTLIMMLPEMEDL